MKQKTTHFPRPATHRESIEFLLNDCALDIKTALGGAAHVEIFVQTADAWGRFETTAEPDSTSWQWSPRARVTKALADGARYRTWLTKGEAADRAGVATKTIERWAQDKRIRQGMRREAHGPRRAVFHPGDVERLSHEVPPPEEGNPNHGQQHAPRAGRGRRAHSA
jgi:hypothetical protein